MWGWNAIKKNKILEFNQYMRSDKMLYNFYADFESLIKKVDGWANNPENSSTTKIGENIPCGCSMSTTLGLTIKKGKPNLYPGKDCMKKFSKSLREHAKISFKKKKMQPLPKKELKSHEDASMLYLLKKFQRKTF